MMPGCRCAICRCVRSRDSASGGGVLPNCGKPNCSAPGPAITQNIKGDAARGEVYYTNSTYLNVQAPLNPIARVRKEGLFHPLIEAGSLTHIWLGEARPSAGALADFVVKTFRQAQNDQIAFSPEFTSCNACQRTCRGLQPVCPSCGSEEVDGITRITGYFTRTSSWNKGKRGELADRYRSSEHYQAEGTV